MDNLHENELSQELTPEELENLKGGFHAISTTEFIAIVRPTIGIVFPPPTIGIIIRAKTTK